MIDLEYYEKYQEILDQCIPKPVLDRLLGRTESGETHGDAWEPDGKYYGENGEELPF